METDDHETLFGQLFTRLDEFGQLFLHNNRHFIPTTGLFHNYLTLIDTIQLLYCSHILYISYIDKYAYNVLLLLNFLLFCCSEQTLAGCWKGEEVAGYLLHYKYEQGLILIIVTGLSGLNLYAHLPESGGIPPREAAPEDWDSWRT